MTEEKPKLKRIEAKQRTAQAGRFLDNTSRPEKPQRLPPGQKIVENWPILDLGVQPAIDTKDWRLIIDGAVTRQQIWTWQDFLDQPQTAMTSDIHCVTSWSRYDNRWGGVSSRHIIDHVQPPSQARHVIAHSYDTYTTNIRMEDFCAPGVLLAASWQGKPIPREHGGPLRLIIPHLYFWKSAKWIKRLEFTTDDQRGFWEERGYHNRADPWAEERYSWQEKSDSGLKKPKE